LAKYGLLPPPTIYYSDTALWLLNCTFMGIVIILLRLSTQTVSSALRCAEAELAERRRIERQLELALEEAQSVARAKAAFFSAMGHELRTPLNAIIGFSEMLASEIFGPLGNPRNSEYVRDIHYSGRRLLSLVNDVLDISRMDAGKMELREAKVSIPEAIANVMRTVEPLALKAGVHIAKTVAPSLPDIFADQQRIEQVITNLVSNSIKFTPKGGDIEISARLDAGSLRVSVADSGIGIAKEDVPKVFERFVQVDSSLARKYEGTGLGLPISKQLIELHGGTLTLESELYEGTVATITLPASRFAKQSALVRA
jgi:signal transduction histidine kinase